MNTKTESKYVASFGWSLAVTSVLSALLVALKETNEATMSLMKSATGHHWITHGIAVVVLFVILGFVFAALRPDHKARSDLNNVAVAVVGATVISGLILAGFFLLA